MPQFSLVASKHRSLAALLISERKIKNRIQPGARAPQPFLPPELWWWIQHEFFDGVRPAVVNPHVVDTFAIDTAGTLYAWGEHFIHTPRSVFPELKLAFANPISIGASSEHFIFSLANKKIAVYGKNQHGQLGCGDKNDRDNPHVIDLNLDTSTTIKKIVTGSCHSMIWLRKQVKLSNNTWQVEDSIRVFGSNRFGQIGLGSEIKETLTPTTLGLDLANTRIKDIYACAHISLILLENNQFYVFGDNTKGQLTFNGQSNVYAPVLRDLHFEDNASIKQVALGAAHIVFLLSNNEVWVCGLNSHGQLGLEERIHEQKQIVKLNINHLIGHNQIIKIATGLFHTVLLLTNNKAIIFGDNSHGQLCLDRSRSKIYLPTLIDFASDVEITDTNTGAFYTIFQDLEGKMLAFGDNRAGQIGIRLEQD